MRLDRAQDNKSSLDERQLRIFAITSGGKSDIFISFEIKDNVDILHIRDRRL